VIARDITERKRAEERIRYMAHHDALTGLPNRLLLRDRIGQAIAHARRNQEQVAVLFLDLDGFKHITTRSATKLATVCCVWRAGVCSAAGATGIVSHAWG